MCGDDKGRLWTYHVANLQKNSFQSGKPVQPTEVTVSPKCPATSQLCFHKLLSGNTLIIFCVCILFWINHDITLTKLIAVIWEHSGITKKNITVEEQTSVSLQIAILLQILYFLLL